MHKEQGKLTLRRKSIALAVAGALGFASDAALAAGALTFSGTTFSEANGNLGAIASTSYLTVSITGETFTGTDGEDFIASGKATVSNLPTGLSATLVRLSPISVQVNLSGNAASHGNANDVSNLTINFADTAFTGGSASSVTGFSKNDLVIDFVDTDTTPPSILSFPSKSSDLTTVSVSLALDEAGSGYYVLLPAAAAAPSVAQVLAGQDASGATASNKGNASMPAATAHVFSVTGLTPNTAYKFYFAGKDVADNQQTAVTTYPLTTKVAGINYANTTAYESNGNLGAVDSIYIVLAGDTFTGSNNEDMVGTGKVVVSHVPAGLTAKVVRSSATTAELSFTGNASNNGVANNVIDLSVVFADGAFTGGSASSLSNTSKTDLAISFVDSDSTPPLSYSMTQTAVSTTGMTVDITVDEASTGYYVVLPAVAAAPTASQVLAGQDAVGGVAAIAGHASLAAKVSTSFAITGLQSNAAYKLYFVAKDAANNQTTTPIAFLFSTQTAGLSYSATSFSELNGNFGTLGSASITLNGDTFSGAVGEDLVFSGKVVVTHLPVGLTARMTIQSQTQATLSFTGSAASHGVADSVNNLTIAFANSAFTGGNAANLENSTKSNLVISFADSDTVPPTSSKNKAGTVSNSTASISSTIDEAGTGYYVVLPANASAPSASQVVAGQDATGAAASIKNSEAMEANQAHAFSVAGLAANLDYKFYLVAKDIAGNAQTTPSVVSFKTGVTGLTYSATGLEEAGGNQGAISPISINLQGDTFTGANGDDLVSSGKVTVSHVPDGLTAHVTRTSATSVTLALSGNAINHGSANSISDLTVVFANSAFAGNSASTLANTSISTLTVSFVNTDIVPPRTSTSGMPSKSNNSASFDFLLDEAGTGYYVVLPAADPVPSALQVIAGQDSTGATTGIKGSATMLASTSHAFVINGLAAKTNYKIYFIGKDTSNNYQDSPYSQNFSTIATGLSYSSTTFNEAGGNQGAIARSVTLTLTGDSFTGADGDDFVTSGKVVVSHLPAGLTASVVRNSATTATLSLSGNATHHANADDVSNFTVAFADSAFVGANAASLDNSNMTNLVIDFVNSDIIPPTFSKMSSAGSLSSSGASVSASIDEAGTGYYVVLPHSASAPSAAQVIAGQDASGVAATVTGSSVMAANTSHVFSLTGLAASTPYTFYFAAKDTSNNPQSSATAVSFTTLAAPVVVVPDPTPNSPSPAAPTTTTVTPGGSATIGSSTVPVNAGVGSTLSVTTGSSGATINLPTPPNAGDSASNAVTVVIGGVNLSVKPTESGSVLKTTTVKLNGNDTTVLNVSNGSAQVSASSVNQPLVSFGTGSNAVLVSSGSASATVITSVDKVTGTTTLTLPKPASGNAADASLKLTIGGQDVNVKPQGEGSAVVSLATVTVNGQPVQVVTVTDGSAVVTASQANQPLLAVGSGASAIILTANSVGSEASSQVDSVTGTTTLSITSGSITLSSNAFAGSNAYAAIKDGKLYAGEVAVLNGAGKISSVRLGSLASNAHSVGDPLKGTAVGYANATVVPNLKGQVARISTSHDFTTVLTTALGAGVASQGQNANGVLLLTLPGGSANALPLGDIVVDTNRADGVTLSGNGKLEVANSGVITTFVPAVADPAQLAAQIGALDKNSSLSIKTDGVLEVLIGGVSYAVQPGWLVSKASGGQAGISVDADGRLLYQDNAGNQQTLYPVFADLTQLLAVFKSQNVDLVATGNDNGTVSAKFQGATYTLAPDYALSVVPASHAHDDWWAESGKFYIKSRDGKTVQGFTIK